MSLVDELKPGLTGLQQLQQMIAMGGHTGIGSTLQFSMTEASDGFVAFEGVPGAFALNPIGTIHGGYAATLLDSACGCAVHSKLAAGQGYTTLELKIAYHKAMTPETGRVRAEGRVISFGRRAAFTEAKLIGPDGKLFASATSTLLVI